jgi:hypothetical protein
MLLTATDCGNSSITDPALAPSRDLSNYRMADNPLAISHVRAYVQLSSKIGR